MRTYRKRALFATNDTPTQFSLFLLFHCLGLPILLEANGVCASRATQYSTLILYIIYYITFYNLII
jgi:hypothetical protein